LKNSLLYLIFFSAVHLPCISFAQERPIRAGGGRLPASLPGGLGNIVGGRGLSSSGGGTTGDSLQHRNYSDDSVAITFRLPFALQPTRLDTSIRDFTTRFPIPAHHIYLGNLGTATRSVLFLPELKSGWDPGFHAFDAYKWKPESVRFFNTNKPYTELNYLLGSKVEQMIEVLHTQNIRPHWNASLHYRLINSPGFFKNQKTNHNNYLITSAYQSVNKRYNNYFILVGNKLQSGESGGLKDDQDYLNDPVYDDRFNIPTKMGGDQPFGSNFFSTQINTGNRYREFSVILRQQYDFGRKDSLVTDSTVIPLFYPKLRFEHSLNYSTYKYEFIDFLADSLFYDSTYSVTLSGKTDSVRLFDSWREITNEFSIYQFPDAGNLQQFLKAGAGIQNIRGYFDSLNQSFYNFYLQGEYRNKTKNQKWDMVLSGKLFLSGLNSGDYHALATLRRMVPKNGSYVELGFRNTNRTPSFIFDRRSSFYIDAPQDFQKENTTHLSAAVFHPKPNLRLSGHYYLVSNYTYISGFYRLRQENTLFNVLQLSVEKVFRLGKNFNWYSDVWFQQKTGGVELNLPLVFTRQRIALEGHFFKNLNLSTGIEVRYHTPYKADNYSPLHGRFFYQNQTEISNRPDISLFIHLRIRSFKAYFRVENLNAASFQNGFGFLNNNTPAPGYIYPGLQIRLGIFWNFVN